MSARDDFGSTAGTSRGYSGGAGGLGNGGIGGGMGGGLGGGGAGINGGVNSRTGLTTGSTIHGNTAFGPAGGMAAGYAMMDPGSMARMGMGPTNELYSQYNTLSGQPMFPGLNSPGQSVIAPNAAAGAWGLAQLQAAQQAKVQQGGLLGNPAVAPPNVRTPTVQQPVPQTLPPTYTPAPVPEEVVPGYRPGYTYNNQLPNGYYPANWGRNPTSYPQWSTGYHGQGNSFPGANNPPMSMPPGGKYQDRVPQSGSDGWGPPNSGPHSGGYGPGTAGYGYGG